MNETKRCMTLRHLNWTICSPQNIFQNRFPQATFSIPFSYMERNCLIDAAQRWSRKGRAGAGGPWSGSIECCMWPFNKEYIHFSKIGFVDSKWSSLNAPGSYTSRSHSLLGSIMECPFSCMLKREMLHVQCSGE